MADLPEQAQRDLDEAERIERELYTQEAQDPPPVDTQQDDPPPAAPEPEVEPTPAQPDVTAQHAESLAQSEQRLRTATGILESQGTELKALRKQVADLETKLTDATKVVPKAASKVTEQDVEAYGEDMIDLVRRATSEAVEPLQTEVERLKAENTELKGSVDTAAQTSAQAQQNVYLDRLSQIVPDWRDVNVNPAFLAWLAATDPLSGTQRQTHLESAVQSLNAEHTATVINAWKTTQAPAAPAKSTHELESQTSPGTSRTPAPSTGENHATKIWTGSDIEAAYTQMRKREIVGEQAAQIEAQIDRAISEGRVTA